MPVQLAIPGSGVQPEKVAAPVKRPRDPADDHLEFPLMCRCPQRPHAHEILVHRKVQWEYEHRGRDYWPFSLRYLPGGTIL